MELTHTLPESSIKRVAEPKYVSNKWSGSPTGSAHPSLTKGTAYKEPRMSPDSREVYFFTSSSLKKNL